MRPFDPPDNLDRLHAALYPPVEVRESYLSNPPDAGDHEHFERIEQQQPQASLDEPAMPSFLRTPLQQYQYRRSMLFAGVGMMDDIAFLPPPESRIITVPQRPQQHPQTWLFPGVPAS